MFVSDKTRRATTRSPMAPSQRLLWYSLLLLCLLQAVHSNYKTERPDYKQWLNYGTKRIKPTGNDIENEIIKSKVEVLGEILKKHVKKIRKSPEQKIELVFLVDASASVGADNFRNEIKFVKKLLADFTVSYNQTRVAVITFSSRNKVIRHIDQVSQASSFNHKCSLLQELPKIRYSGGGTYTLGAMLEAQAVLALSRPDAAKAVILLTDGFSNGGDPVPAAEYLRTRGATVFTFGIREGNVQELYQMATEPKEEHSYFLDSFEEFEALARRALHEDLHAGQLMPQDQNMCSTLCPKGGNCCDQYASCTCGTHTGVFTCTCKPGYYGTGLKGDCRPCPAGTYRDSQGPGDISSCKACPDPHMYSEIGSTSTMQCYCKRGYKQVGLSCQMLQCPVLAAPENGYFLRNTCNNVVNAACGVRCNPGYKLSGASIRLCNANGTWTGGNAKCVMQSCPLLKNPKHGTMLCSQSKPTMDTECHFACDPGYQLVGSKRRTCLPMAMWDGLRAYCKPIFCSPLPELRHGIIKPASCIAGKSKYGTICQFACDNGYQLNGPAKSTCIAPGNWSEGSKKPKCIDVKPPAIQCPEDQRVSTLPYENFANVSWKKPYTKDNSKMAVHLSTVPATTIPMKLKIGSHKITYLAKDAWGNKASCSFTITVLDKEPPRVDWCDSPPTFLAETDEVDVYWEEPSFTDNSGGIVKMSRSRDPGRFSQGETEVVYWAEDMYGNKASCNITIDVQKHACNMPVDPINGVTNCTEDPNAVFCSLTCDEGYAFAMRPKQDYFCAYDGLWLPDNNPMPFPDCSVTSVSNTIAHTGELAMDDDSSVCDDIFFLAQVENQLEKKLEEALNALCNSDIICEVAAVEAVCEDILEEAEEEFNSIDFGKKRRRRDTQENYKSFYWPNSGDKDDGWIYWRRGDDGLFGSVLERRKRDAGVIEYEDMYKLQRTKRFSSYFTDLFSSRKPDDTEEESKITANNGGSYLGVFTDVITRSMVSDINPVRYTSFLTNLRANNDRFTTDDFYSSFAREFGDEKLAMLKELAINIPGLEETLPKNRTIRDNDAVEDSIDDDGWPPVPSNNWETSGDYIEVNNTYSGENHTPVPVGELELGAAKPKKNFKLKFQVSGSGQGAEEILSSAVTGILSSANGGDLDVSFGDKQLKVAAIRLKEDPEYICEVGSIVQGNICVKCPVGTFFNVVLKECMSCPQGSYQPKEGQVSCLVCPENTSTKVGNGKTDADCKAKCLPGSYATDGLEPCTTCDIGQYQDEYGSTSCAACPYGTTTWRRGSWLVEECKPACEPGKVSETGLDPCFQCPVGLFQEKSGQTECYRCPDDAATAGPGSTSMIQCEGVDENNQAAYTDLETLPMNDCFGAPCQNNGHCSPMDSGYVCQCAPGYSGAHCETDINECESEPCLNNATCLDMLNGFQCNCLLGFNGTQCEENIDDCNPNPCQNEGTCVDEIDAFKCVCQSGFTGEICDINIDECAESPCASGSTCQDLLNDYICVCSPGITGRHCQTNIDECESSPCVHGFCTDGLNTFSCSCEPGYTGEICNIDIDECASQPCLNNGKCTDWVNSFTCECTPGFSGKFCESEMATDFVLEFPQGDILDYAIYDGLYHSETEESDKFFNSLSSCFWMRTDDRDHYGVPFSYATRENDNSFSLVDYQGFVLYVNGEKRITDVSTNDGQWHFVCVTWTSTDGSWNIYLDGNLKDGGLGLSADTQVNASGILVLGQEQDQYGGEFSPPESFKGELTYFNIWGEVLTHTAVKELFTKCERYVGDVRGWPDLQSGVKGKLMIKTLSFCRGCGIPFKPLYGNVDQSQSAAGAKVNVTCNEGYKLHTGEEVRTCLVYGKWSGDEPECKPLTCGFMGYLVNGKVEGESYLYGDTVSYSCNPGFKLKGEPIRTCSKDGRWIYDMPTCEAITCPFMESDPNGIVIYPLSEYLPSNEMRFNCYDGYQMDGPAIITCQDDGNWDGQKPSCQPKTCNHLPSIENGDVSQVNSNESPGSEAKVECKSGFKVKGDPIITCKDDGTWSQPMPECVKAECEPPPPVVNGNVKIRKSTVGKEASYKCDDGYEVVGENNLHCQLDGTWSAPYPQCLGFVCPEPEVPSNAQIPQKDIWRVGDILVYSCIIGYKLVGNGNLTCEGNDWEEGEWDDDVPSCEIVKCPAADHPLDGIVSIIERPVVESPVAEYIPIIFGELYTSRRRRSVDVQSRKLVNLNKKGFHYRQKRSPIDVQSRKLVKSKKNSFQYRQKRSPFDDEFPPVLSDNGVEDNYDYDYSELGQEMGQSQDYEFGGQTMGSEYDFGQEMGTGSEYDDIEFGQETSDGFDFGQSSDGFEFGQSSDGFEFGQSSDGFEGIDQGLDDLPDFLKPAFDTDSFNSGNLTLDEYEIKRKEAESIVLTDAVYGTKVEYTCKPGYKLIGEEQSSCTDTGDWSSPQPLCYEEYCVKLEAIENGWLDYQGSGVNSRVEYNCNPAYSLNGEFERICQPDKSWTNEAPTCELVDCGEPDQIVNGTIEYTSTIYGAEATYSCFEGFVLEGSVDRHCSISGFWNNTIAHCVSIVCPTPDTIEDGYIEYDGELEVTSIVKYECKDCYDLDGPISRTCLVDGTWTLEQPVCNLKHCDPVPEFFENGKIIGNDNSCESMIEYECNPGYKLNGKRKATCTKKKRWSHRYPPTCEAIGCGVPDGIPNGKIIGDSFSFTDKIEYKCNSCFELSGVSIRVCQADGSWSDDSPVCNEITCTKPPLPTNGKVRLSGMDCGDDAKVVCDSGYRLDGAQYLKCGTDGKWDKEVPFCWPVICPTAPKPEYSVNNGTVEFQYEAFSVLKYECEVGYYTTVNDTRLICSNHGEWEGTIISCYPVNCGAPATLTNGRIIGGSYTYESHVSFECDDGYELLGDPEAECLEDGRWSNNVTTCSRILCPAPMQLTYGKIVTSDPDNSYGASIQYQCNNGYIMSGDSTLTCAESGEWQGIKPSCQPVTCPEPYEVFASLRNGNNYEFNNSLTYTCEIGYLLVGSESITCQADGTWSDDFPFCDLILCLPISPIYHGSWEQIDINGIPLKTEPEQSQNLVKHTKKSKSAKIMEQIIDEFPEEFDHKYGDKVRFSCDKGYELSSEELSTCTEIGWSIAAPRCDPVQCPIPIPIQHGSVKGSDNRYVYGTTITYECNEGYELIGENTSTCTENKTWTGEKPFCKIVSCPVPAVLENGQTIGLNYTYRSILSYACDAGFKLQGVNFRTCESNGIWSAELPVCVEIFCSLPSDVSNGNMDYNTLKVGGTARYSCLEGFRMEGSPVLNCLDDGDWDTSIPSCIQVDCGTPPTNDYLVISGEQTIYNSKVMYSCERGFRTVGSLSSTCLQSGRWSSSAPTCELVSCPQPPRLNHGKFVKTETHSRYIFEEKQQPEVEPLVILPSRGTKGQKGRKGRKGGKGAKGAKGKIKTRPVPEKLIQAPKCIKCDWPLGQQYFPHPSDCKKFIQCSPLGPAEKDCAIGTHFDINLSVCNHAMSTPCITGDYDTIDGYCGSESNDIVAHGTVAPSMESIISKVPQYVVDNIITWSCDEGYTPEGPTTANCTQDGTWSSSPPRCRRVSCGIPELPDYSILTGEDFLYGGNITYKCRDGYNLQGEAILTCQGNGNWSALPPKCVPVPCGSPVLPIHVTAAYVIPEHGIKNAFGTSVTFDCEEGYELMGGKYQVCENEGLWVGSAPNCVERLCGAAPLKKHSSVYKDESGHPQTAKYTCLKGYESSGITDITCQLGKWTKANFTCLPLNCYEPTIPRMGKITAKSFTFGATGNYSCLYGYQLHGNPSVACGLDAEWIGDIPECLPVDCGEPEVPDNGNVESDHTDLDAAALYYCNPGFKIYGNDTRVCLGDGQWSGDFPQCLRKDCGEVQPPKNGFVVGVGQIYGECITFACEDGYELEGDGRACCLNTGNWSSNVPQCQPISCGIPILPPNLQEQNASFVYPERLVYQCTDGHIPRGDLSTTCEADGKWTRIHGQCSKISCGRPKVNNDGSIIIGRSFYYNDRVIFRCPPGKKLSGSAVVACNGDGEWSSIPSCTGACVKKCLNGGVCLTNNKCTCRPGFTGDRCQRAMCKAKCLNGGTCIGPYKCLCKTGFSGHRCQTPVCEQGCGKGGRCIGPNVCHCNKGYSGSTCEIEEPDYYYDFVQQFEGETNGDDWDLVSLRRRENGYQRLNV